MTQAKKPRIIHYLQIFFLFWTFTNAISLYKVPIVYFLILPFTFFNPSAFFLSSHLTPFIISFYSLLIGLGLIVFSKTSLRVIRWYIVALALVMGTYFFPYD